MIEFVHTATLLHDDVVDASELRRGLKTANVVWGNEAGVLVGDFLYSRAFQMIASLNNTNVLEVLANATNLLAEGEVMQLINRNKATMDESSYMEVIRRKTAMLFSAAAEIGTIIANANFEAQKAMAKFGLHLGNAFQIIDDLLDYTASPEVIGKNIGDDLAEGKLTLPLIYALQECNDKQKHIITKAIHHASDKNFSEILSIIQQTNALDKTKVRAIKEVEQAKTYLPSMIENQYHDALLSLLDFAVTRNN